MTSNNTLQTQEFRRILSRNIAVPLTVGMVSAALFIGLIMYLLSVLSWVDHTNRVIAQANGIQKLVVDQETAMRGFLITGDESFLAPYEMAKPKMKVNVASLRALMADSPDQAARLDRIMALQAEWDTFAQEAISERRMGKDLTQIVRSGRGKRTTDEIRKEFDDFTGTEERVRLQRTATAGSVTNFTVVFYLIFSLGVAALLAWLGRRELINLSVTYAAVLHRQEEHAQYLEGQAWLRDGQSELAETLAGQQSLHMAGRNVLEFMARKLGSVVGALYVRDEGGSYRRVATYGFPGESTPWGQAFAAGQSLVNEVASQRKVISLDNVPADYIRVTSGLGQGAPHSLMLGPIVNDGEVNGVVELGFVRPLTPRDAELVKMVAGNLGASVEAARYRQRLQDVLEETQQLNEELQVQQEELRTANEELEEQSRALKESQTNLQNQQAELEQTNEQLSEQATQLEQQRDVLDQRNAALHSVQEELEKRAGEVERASRYKSEFLANMSHELRTPLNSSLILAKLLAENPQGNLSAEQVKFSESIYSAGNDLLNLINDILDISKVEAGKMEVRPETTHLRRLASALEQTFRPLTENKKLKFSITLEPGLPDTIFTDRQRVEQVLKNLLSNAVKFTDKGSVSLTIGRDGEGVAFRVQDSGIGIGADQQQLIFEAFHQADGTTSRRFGGTGLGLSISRTLATMLGGSIAVTSTPGEGSTFTLYLPLTYDASQADLDPGPAPAITRIRPGLLVPPAPAAAPAPRPARLPPAFTDDRDQEGPPGRRCVLVIEDEPQFAKILYDLAHELGYRCLVAHETAEGCELAEEFLPDAVLLDMRLPDGSGLEVLQHLKETPSTRHIPVHVISVEDRAEAALQLGAIGYAVKPATREQLKEVFGRIEAKLSQKVKRVLLVEDDAVQRDAIIRLVAEPDTEIVAVEFGEKALEELRNSMFDCMIIDLTLPDMHGSQLLKRMAAEEIRAFPPVIVYTARNLTRDEEAELLRYSRSIIIKGARSPERLLDEVTLFLHKVETELSNEHQKMLKTARSRDKVFEGRKILVVDDDVRNIFALTSALEQKGALVEIGRNGREALEKLAAVPDIDMVLMDVMMPEMDGYTATREIRKHRQWMRLPIIAVTAKAMKDDQARCLEAGANDYMAKPIELERLFSLMRVWLPKMERV